MREEIKAGDIECEMMIGNTKIKICAVYCRGLLPREIESILAEIAAKTLADSEGLKHEPETIEIF